jgi:opacity protein-like surface antigen
MNQEHTIMNKIPAIYSLLLIFTAGLVCADDPGGKSIAKSASAKSTAVAALSKPSLRGDKDWSLELGSGILVSDIRTDNTGYTFIPVNLTAALKLDDVTLDNVYGGMFRGYTEWVLRGFGMIVAHGIESRFVGMNMGPRYHFCQPGWKLKPFIEGNVGFAFTDSRGLTTLDRGDIGQGQDFAFNFGIIGGVRYDIDDTWFVRLSGVFTHFSNAGLSEPDNHNNSIDAAGPELSVGIHF